MKKTASILASLLYATQASAFETFTVNDIRLEGLQRISIGTVFNYLPIKIGDRFSNEDSANAIRTLYKTGFFKDVRFERENNVLVIFVSERPSIDKINLDGNDAIESEQLLKALGDQGFKVNGIYDESVLAQMSQELKRQYYSLGKYGVSVETVATPLERNRVEIDINISEGEEAKVYAFNVIGNTVYDDDKLNSIMELGARGMFGGRENYSRQVLAGDLETLRSYYMDRGYINFQIDSTQVSLTPDKQDVYLTANITEGKVFTIRDVKMVGELILTPEVLEENVTFSKGEIFSRRKVSDTRKNITDRLAELGYPFSNVNISPNVDNDSQTVELTLFVDPGRRVYVRRVNISGNTKTDDEVVRRELRQFENDWLSTKQTARSKTRLDRTGFFDNVTINTPTVPGTVDQVDLDVQVNERSTGNLSLGIGYSETQGALLNFGISQDNFMGGGKKLALKIDNSSATQQYSFSLTDPYFTNDGISQSMSFLIRELDAEEANISNYIVNTKSARLGYGLPISENASTNVGFAFENTEMITGTTTAQHIQDFITNNNNSSPVYDMFKLNGGWRYDTRNRAVFADEGFRTRVYYEASTPGSDLEFYKIGFSQLQYFKLSENYSFRYKIEADYGTSYGDTTSLPPFERYFAGGSRSVRGYDGNSLGAKDINNDPIGGDRRLLASVELFVPNPFADQSKEIRLSTFVDSGYVWVPDSIIDADENDSIEPEDGLGELRFSAGIGMIWITPVGIMRFSYAVPLNDKPGDEITNFQFTLGGEF